MASRAYSREIYYHVDGKNDVLIHTDESIENDLFITTGELEEYAKFDNFDEFLEFFKKNRGMMNVYVGTNCVKLDIWGVKQQTVSKRCFLPCSILIKYEEISLKFKDLLDMDADMAIQYIKERWNDTMD